MSQDSQFSQRTMTEQNNPSVSKNDISTVDNTTFPLQLPCSTTKTIDCATTSKQIASSSFFGPATFPSPSSTFAINSDFFYDSESDDDELGLAFSRLFIQDPNNTIYSDGFCDEGEDDDELFHLLDSVPLSHRLTPPPLLCEDSRAMFGQQSEDKQDDDDTQIKSVFDLSVTIPPTSPQESVEIEIVTPKAAKQLPQTTKKVSRRRANHGTLRGTSHKSFEFNVDKQTNCSYALDKHLVQHIESLYDDRVSE